MPWNPAQHRLFEWAAHNPQAAAAAGYKIPQQKAATMAGEGIKNKPKMLADAVRRAKSV